MGSGGTSNSINNKKLKKSICVAYFISQFINRKDKCLLWLYLYFLFSPSSHQREYSFHLQGDAANAWKIWTGVFEDPSIGYGDTHYSCLPNILFSFFLTSRALIYFRTARCPAKEKKNQHSLVSYTTKNGHITVPPSDMNKTVVKWSSSRQA